MHARHLLEIADLDRIKARRALVEQRMKSEQAKPSDFARTPYFCSGCPHNTSTKVPDGSRAMAGIGCHFLASWMPRSTETFTQMGGEGVPWVGMAPFTETPHIFANLGDGTFNHSGSLAIRQAVAANRPYVIDANIGAESNPGGAGIWELPGLGQSKPMFGGRHELG